MKNHYKKLGLSAYFMMSLVGVFAFSAAAQNTTSATGTIGAPISSPAAVTVPGALPSSAGVMANIARAEAAGNANDLVLAYGDAVRDAQLARGALTQLLTDYFRLRSLATSAMQASQAVDEAALRFAIFQAAQQQVNVQQNQQILAQQQRLVEQNDALLKQNDAIIKQNERMITLLGQIARNR